MIIINLSLLVSNASLKSDLLTRYIENKTLELFNNLILAVRLSDQSYIRVLVFSLLELNNSLRTLVVKCLKMLCCLHYKTEINKSTASRRKKNENNILVLTERVERNSLIFFTKYFFGWCDIRIFFKICFCFYSLYITVEFAVTGCGVA
ncbi:hypothetical protein QTP88_004977 [Uroleucon formosanum]